MVLSVIESDRTLSHVTLSENIVVIERFCSTVQLWWRQDRYFPKNILKGCDSYFEVKFL